MTDLSVRTRFIEDVMAAAELSAFPVGRKNALSLIQLTLFILEKEAQARQDKHKYIRSILRRSEGSGLHPEHEEFYSEEA